MVLYHFFFTLKPVFGKYNFGKYRFFFNVYLFSNGNTVPIHDFFYFNVSVTVSSAIKLLNENDVN